MNATLMPATFRPIALSHPASVKTRFCEQFRRSLRSCLQKGFSVEESFGMIWMETWEEIPLPDEHLSEVYDELIRWAKKSIR